MSKSKLVRTNGAEVRIETANLPTTIPCSVYECPNEAEFGGIFQHGSNPRKPIFPVYYYCTDDYDRLTTALSMWELSS